MHTDGGLLTQFRALSLIAVGLLVVAIDFRTEALDLAPDPLGWLLIAVGAHRLAQPAATLLAALAAGLSFADVYLGFRYILIGPDGDIVETCPINASCDDVISYVTVSTCRSILIAVAAIAGGASIILVLNRMRGAGSSRIVTPTVLTLLQIAVAALWVVPVVAVIGTAIVRGERYRPFWTGGLAYLSATTTVVVTLIAIAIAIYSTHTGTSIETPDSKPTSG